MAKEPQIRPNEIKKPPPPPPPPKKENADLAAALDLAMFTILNYQYDIKNSQEDFEFNLVEAGFCQGIAYKGVIERIEKLSRGG